MTDAGLLGLVVGLINGSNRRNIERQTREIIAAMPEAPAPPTPTPTPAPAYVPRNYWREQQTAEADRRRQARRERKLTEAYYDQAMARFRQTGDKRDLPQI